MEIRGCPFCGFVPDPRDSDFAYPVTRTDQKGRQLYHAGCIESAGGCGAEVTGWSRAKAIERWNMRMAKTGISWDYELPGYYHIFAFDGPLDGGMDSFVISVPETEENTRDIQLIVDALRRIEGRLNE